MLGQLLLQPAGHGLHLLLALGQQGLQRCQPLLQQLRQRRLGRRINFAQQAPDVAHAGLHPAPDGMQGQHRADGQLIDMVTPVVLHRLGQHGGFVGHQLFVPQTAAIKRVFAQHALAPGVDGEHRRVVHAFSGHGQTPGGLLAGAGVGTVLQQLQQQRVVHPIRLAKGLGGLQQTLADATRQFVGGGAGKGHHQNLRRHQRAHKGVFTAMADDQAQVQRGDGPGFTGAGTGLDQARAPQGKPGGQQGLGGGAHVGSS